jgi:hypothetical protein
MREILFRGKRVKDGKWVDGSLFSSMTGQKFIRWEVEDDGAIEEIMQYEVIPETVGQFTGLVDRNGFTKIFEGDVIHDEDSGAIGEVFFNNDGTGGYSTWFLGVGYNCALSVLDSTNLVIIGTIHDNPELVEAR